MSYCIKLGDLSNGAGTWFISSYMYKDQLVFWSEGIPLGGRGEETGMASC